VVVLYCDTIDLLGNIFFRTLFPAMARVSPLWDMQLARDDHAAEPKALTCSQTRSFSCPTRTGSSASLALHRPAPSLQYVGQRLIIVAAQPVDYLAVQIHREQARAIAVQPRRPTYPKGTPQQRCKPPAATKLFVLTRANNRPALHFVKDFFRILAQCFEL